MRKLQISILFSIPFSILAISALAVNGQSTSPKPPDDTWSVVPVQRIEGHDGYNRYPDLFKVDCGSCLDSPAAKAYPAFSAYAKHLTRASLCSYLATLVETVTASPTFTDAQYNGERLRTSLIAELDALLEKTEKISNPDGPLAWNDIKDLVDDHWKPAQWTWKDRKIVDADGQSANRDLVTDTLFFSGSASQIVLSIGSKPVGSLKKPSDWQYYATLEQALEFRVIVARIDAVLSAAQLDQWQVTGERLADMNAAWSNYLEYGYSQYPWESFINSGLKTYSWTRPPGSQLVLLHPEISILVDARQIKGARYTTGMIVHGLGNIWYLGDRNSGYLGVSLSGSITGSSDWGVGYGGTVHFGHAKAYKQIPHISLSCLYQYYQNGDEGLAVGINVDLWRLVTDNGESMFLAKATR